MQYTVKINSLNKLVLSDFVQVQNVFLDWNELKDFNWNQCLFTMQSFYISIFKFETVWYNFE